VALVRTDVSEELSASFIRVTRIDELGTTPALTTNRRTLRRNTNTSGRLGPVARILEGPHGVICQKRHSTSGLRSRTKKLITLREWNGVYGVHEVHVYTLITGRPVSARNTETSVI
jgi:hypothetical protein